MDCDPGLAEPQVWGVAPRPGIAEGPAQRCRGLVLIQFSLWAFGRAELHARRTGKLKRVG